MSADARDGPDFREEPWAVGVDREVTPIEPLDDPIPAGDERETLELPWVAPGREYAEAGALISYGPDGKELARRAATYVVRILKGVKPWNLPIEQSTRIELIVNVKTAKILGLTIPPAVLARADEVIQ